MRILIALVALLAVLNTPAIAHDLKHKHNKSGPPMKERTDIERSVTLPDGRLIAVLRPEVVRELQILPLPDQPTAAISVGTYWACTEGPGSLDFCDLRIVICDTDGQMCTELP